MPGTAKTLISIHDVMPETLDDVAILLDALKDTPAEAVVLLVVPGRPWDQASLNTLKQWQTQGYPLAGHGWHHHCQPPKTLYHKLHAALLSRDAAEHLSLSREELKLLLEKCHDWFEENALKAPDFYVPPAWAMGALKREDLDALPFKQYETLSGLYDSERKQKKRMPLLGFEADTLTRALFLRAFNWFNWQWARWRGSPIRLGLHPADHRLKLAPSMYRYIEASEPERLTASC
ncbi:MAG: polysaccharide deacetylase family protein [Pseudomonadota bacterium]